MQKFPFYEIIFYEIFKYQIKIPKYPQFYEILMLWKFGAIWYANCIITLHK